MSDESINVTIRMADGSKKESIQVYTDETAQDIINAARDHWKLQPDISYQLYNTRTSVAFTADTLMSSDAVHAIDVLELNPQITAAVI